MQEEEEGEQGAVVCRQSVKDRQRQFRRGLSGEKCVQNGRSQKAESAMSWGTELWVCFNSSNDAFDQVFGFFALRLDADKTATLRKWTGREVPCYLVALCRKESG